MNLASRIEAILYASREPISISSIAEILGEGKTEVTRELRKLVKSYESRESALVILRTGRNYKMELRKEFRELVIPVSEPEFAPLEIDVISFIASHEGCSRTDLRRKFSSRFIEPVDRFRKEKMIAVEKKGNAEVFRVTKRFYTHFGVTPAEVKDAIRTVEGSQ